MISFKNVIPKVQELLEAVPYFAGEQVITDDGTKDSVVEKALRDRGFCVVIAPIMHAPKKDSQASLSIVSANVFIIVQVNPKINATTARKNIYEAIQAIVVKLKAYAGVNQNDRFDIADDAIELSSFDPGLWAYDLTFTKQAALFEQQLTGII